MAKKRKAAHYGQIELIRGVVCDGYVLDDNTTVLSERGTADLLDIDHKRLRDIVTHWPPEELKPFVTGDFEFANSSVKVTAKNSPYYGKEIVVYTIEEIQTLITTYALAFTSDALEQSQHHIGERCLTLLQSLVGNTLTRAIYE